jgi:hypothetical protein
VEWLWSASSLKRLSGDLSLVSKLKFQLFDHLGQPLSREWISGFQGEPAGLLQFPFQCSTVHPRHLKAPAIGRRFGARLGRRLRADEDTAALQLDESLTTQDFGRSGTVSYPRYPPGN